MERRSTHTFESSHAPSLASVAHGSVVPLASGVTGPTTPTLPLWKSIYEPWSTTSGSTAAPSIVPVSPVWRIMAPPCSMRSVP